MRPCPIWSRRLRTAAETEPDVYLQYRISNIEAESGFLVESPPPGEDNMMEKAKEPAVTEIATTGEFDAPYQGVFGDVSNIIDAARESAARSVNAAMTAAYWLIGRRIVEFEQSGAERAEYGAALLERLAADLTGRFGRGFSRQERPEYAPVLPFVSTRANSPDAVWQIAPTPRTADSPDAVWRIGT